MRGSSALRSTLPLGLLSGAVGEALARARPFVSLGARSLLVAAAVTATLVVLGASGWSSSVVSWLIGVAFGLAALLLPPWPAVAVVAVTCAAVLVPVLSAPTSSTQVVTVAAELAVAGVFAAALRAAMVSLRRFRKTVADRDADLAAVRGASQRLTLPMSSDELCLEVARAALGLTGATYGRLVLTSPGRSRIILLAASGPDGETLAQGERAAALEVGASRGLAIETDTPVRVGPDVRTAVALPSWYPVSSTYLAVPIVIDGETRGELVAAEKRGGAGFTPICEMLLAIYAVEAGAVLKSALLSEAVDEALEAASAERSRSGVVTERGDVVLDIARRLTETLDRSAILQMIVRELNQHLASDAATIRVVDGEELRVAAWAGMSDAEAAALPAFRCDEGWFAEIIRTGRTWPCEDLEAEPAFAEAFRRYDRQRAWRGDMVGPLIHGGKVIGVISAVTRAPRRWTQDDVDFVSALAAHASIAIHNADLFETAEGLTRELRGLVEMSSDLTRSLDSAQVADRIARHLASAMAVPACRISYWERDGDHLVPLGHYPDVDAWISDDAAVAHDRGIRRAIRDQVAVVLERVSVLPLVAKGQSIGVVELRGDGPERLTAAQLELGRTMANEAAMALENARLYEEARNQADRDQLTGFFNHRFLHERLGEEIVRAQRNRAPLGLLMLDVDDFKLVNDTFGHLFGDRVLQWAAEVIRATLRLPDVPARYGGDEFAILLPDADTDAAEQVGARIGAAFAARSFEWDGRGPLPISVSIGAASFPAEARSGQQLIASADRALYRRKQTLGGTGATPRRSRGQARATKAVVSA